MTCISFYVQLWNERLSGLDGVPGGKIRHGVEIGRFLAPEGAEADAVQNHFIRLQNQYAHLIHKHIVTKE